MATTRKSAAFIDGPPQAMTALAPCDLPLPADFEAALAELETLVVAMEDGDMSLEASLAAYKRGVALARACQDRLAQAEQQVKVLEGELLKPLDAQYLEDDSGA